MRGSRCTRFEVHTLARREDTYNLLLLVCYKGGALWEHTTIYLTTDLSLIRYASFGWDRVDSLFITEVILNLTISQGIVVVDNIRECTNDISLPVDYGGIVLSHLQLDR